MFGSLTTKWSREFRRKYTEAKCVAGWPVWLRGSHIFDCLNSSSVDINIILSPLSGLIEHAQPISALKQSAGRFSTKTKRNLPEIIVSSLCSRAIPSLDAPLWSLFVLASSKTPAQWGLYTVLTPLNSLSVKEAGSQVTFPVRRHQSDFVRTILLLLVSKAKWWTQF